MFVCLLDVHIPQRELQILDKFQSFGLKLKDKNKFSISTNISETTSYQRREKMYMTMMTNTIKMLCRPKHKVKSDKVEH